MSLKLLAHEFLIGSKASNQGRITTVDLSAEDFGISGFRSSSALKIEDWGALYWKT
jgi:hypothetical protein